MAEWTAQAACKPGNGYFTTLRASWAAFFPDTYTADRLRLPRKICAECPVGGECLREALRLPREDDKHGIRNGTTPEQRVYIRFKARRQAGFLAACEWCGELYERQHRSRFCSADCVRAVRRNRSRWARIA